MIKAHGDVKNRGFLYPSVYNNRLFFDSPNHENNVIYPRRGSDSYAKFTQVAKTYGPEE